MKKKTYLYAVTSLILSMTLAGCGSSPDQKIETPQKTAAAEVSAVTAEPVQMKEGMKDVEIYGTVYTIPEDWYTEVIDENNTAIYFSTEKTERANDKIVITRLPDVWDGGTSYADSEEVVRKKAYEDELKLFDKNSGWQEWNKEETAGRYAAGEKGYYSLETWIFMNSYTDAVVIRYMHAYESTKESYSDQVHEVIDSMKFSYAGFEKTEGSSKEKDTSAKTSKEAEDQEYQKKLAKKVYKWCQKEISAYNKKEGKDTGEEYLDFVVMKAAEEFKLTEEEVRELYEMAEAEGS